MNDKCILITGGTGSFGEAMVNRLFDSDCREIRIFSRDECKQERMRLKYADDRLTFHIGDVRDRDSVMRSMRGVNVVFHAAALKQVPSCEFFPLEAIATNVQGSRNVLDAAMDSGVERAVFLSTDKAVLPINAMGMTKALMEKLVIASALRSDSKTKVAIVRYGNVMGSRGSVIPLFARQLRTMGRVTLTSPTMTRFLLSLGDAIDLALYAMENAEQGDLFIRKAPACSMERLGIAVANLLRDAGLVSVPFAAEVIGVRHGEKIHETLATSAELTRAEDMGQYWRVRPDARDLNYAKYFTEGVASTHVDFTSENARQLTVPEIKGILSLMPEFRDATVNA